jgi:cardiolipin synthase
VTQVFEEDLKRSKQITFDMWRDRPWREKALEKLSSLFSSQL